MEEEREREEAEQRDARPRRIEASESAHRVSLPGGRGCRTIDSMGLGFSELLIILAIVLIIFGPGKLPGLGSGIGNAIRNFRKAVNRPDAIDVTPPDRDER